MSHERYKLLHHKITCALHSNTHSYRVNSVCWTIWLDYYLLKLIAKRERGVVGELG